MSNCIVCKQPIESEPAVETDKGLVHSGTCLDEYKKINEVMNESGDDTLLEDTQLLM